jgi:lipoyl(octanoyl) transferase
MRAILDACGIEVRRLGVVPYAEALELQRALVEDRTAGRVGDVLLLLQHPDVITLGVRSAVARAHIRVDSTVLAQRGIDVYETGRGGDITYHGPGQVVGYPILDLRPDRCDVHQYVWDVEEVLIRVAADYGVRAGRQRGLTGVWAGPGRSAKLAAIGVRISRWITSHGFAFNVSTQLERFDLIVPCGIPNKGVTSLEKLGSTVGCDEVEARIALRFGELFGRRTSGVEQLTAARGGR